MTNPKEFPEQSLAGPGQEQSLSSYPLEQTTVEPTGENSTIPASMQPYAPELVLPRSKKAITSLVLSVLGIFFYPLEFIAIILGVLARSDIAKGRSRGKGIATTGLVIAIIISVLYILYVIGRLSGA